MLKLLEDDRWYFTKEIIQRSGKRKIDGEQEMGASLLYRMIKRKQLPARRFAGRLIIQGRDFNKLLRGDTSGSSLLD